MKLDCSKVLTDYDGIPLHQIKATGRKCPTCGRLELVESLELTIGIVLSEIFGKEDVEGVNISPLKGDVIARRSFAGGQIEFDESDYSLIKDVLEKNTKWTRLVRAQILRELLHNKDADDADDAKPVSRQARHK